jgi:exopolyphosphatase/guanosine-5'-triphosphate,3'-diphosphate pyrophosphatase
LLIEHTGHPLHVVDNFAMERPEAIRMLELFSHLSPRSLEKVPGLSRRRAPHLPLAALLLLRLLQAARPARLVFSAAGLREGYFFDRLPQRLRKEDPLLAACAALAREGGRFPDHGEELMGWMNPLFTDEDAAGRRRRNAACLLGDLFWSEHPDYRAEQAFLRVERLPIPGLDHGDRVAIAMALHSRYQGGDDLPPTLSGPLRLLSEEEQRHARLVGHLLRLANSVSGGVPGVLSATRLRRAGDALVFEMPEANPIFAKGSFERRFDRLARAAGAERLDLAWV